MKLTIFQTNLNHEHMFIPLNKKTEERLLKEQEEAKRREKEAEERLKKDRNG